MGFWVWGSGVWVLGFGLWVSGSGFHEREVDRVKSGIGFMFVPLIYWFRVSSFRFLGFVFRVPGFRISCFEFQVSEFRILNFRLSFEFQISGLRVLDRREEVRLDPDRIGVDRYLKVTV